MRTFFNSISVEDNIKNKQEFRAILYVLGFSIFSNLEKRISEKIIDGML